METKQTLFSRLTFSPTTGKLTKENTSNMLEPKSVPSHFYTVFIINTANGKYIDADIRIIKRCPDTTILTVNFQIFCSNSTQIEST